MRHEHATQDAKGWLAGRWECDLQISVGFATEAIDEPHLHPAIAEICSSEDYFPFVVHSPGIAGNEAEREKQVVSRSRRGL